MVSEVFSLWRETRFFNIKI